MDKSEKIAVCREILSDPMFIERLSGECDHSEWLRLMNKFVDSLEDDISETLAMTTIEYLTSTLLLRAVMAMAADIRINIAIKNRTKACVNMTTINIHRRYIATSVSTLPMHVNWNGTTLTIQNQPTIQGMYDYYKFVRFFSNERGAYITRK